MTVVSILPKTLSLTTTTTAGNSTDDSSATAATATKPTRPGRPRKKIVPIAAESSETIPTRITTRSRDNSDPCKNAPVYTLDDVDDICPVCDSDCNCDPAVISSKPRLSSTSATIGAKPLSGRSIMASPSLTTRPGRPRKLVATSVAKQAALAIPSPVQSPATMPATRPPLSLTLTAPKRKCMNDFVFSIF